MRAGDLQQVESGVRGAYGARCSKIGALGPRKEKSLNITSQGNTELHRESPVGHPVMLKIFLIN